MIKTAVILAAGKGEKAWPYGETRAKAVFPVINTPIISLQVRYLRELGVERFIVVVGYLGQQVKSAVLREGVDAEFVQQREMDGPVSGLLDAAELLDEDPVLVLHGDVVATPESYKALLDSWKPSMDACLLVHRMGREDPSEWFCASIDGERLVSLAFHSRGTYSHRLCGISILSQKALDYARSHPGMTTKLDVGAMPTLERDLAQTFQDMIDAGEEVGAVETKGPFVDVDKPWHLLEANGRMADYLASTLAGNEIDPEADISDKADISGFVRIGPGSRIGKNVQIHGNIIVGSNTSITNGAMIGPNVVVGDRTRIRDYCQVGSHSVIGNECVVGHCAEFGGVLMNKVYLYHYCELSGIIGTATDIGAATVCGTLRFDDGRTTHVVKGRKEVPLIGANETYIGEYCRTGVNAIIMPGVKVGPYSILGPGTIIYKDVPSRTLVLAKQEHVTKPWGPEKYGW